jgi:arginyl-tRNA synthetase
VNDRAYLKRLHQEFHADLMAYQALRAEWTACLDEQRLTQARLSVLRATFKRLGIPVPEAQMRATPPESPR